MQKKKKDFSRTERLGSYQLFGTDYRVLTMRGWVIVETWNELQEEIDNINSLIQKGVEWVK